MNARKLDKSSPTAVMIVLFMARGLVAAEPGGKFVAYDGFNGKFALNWQPVRHDPEHASLIKHPGKLTITTQRGSIHGDEKKDEFGEGHQAKNLFLIANPLSEHSHFAMTTRVENFLPETHFQQAGLLCYDDDDNFLKERIGQKET